MEFRLLIPHQLSTIFDMSGRCAKATRTKPQTAVDREGKIIIWKKAGTTDFTFPLRLSAFIWFLPGSLRIGGRRKEARALSNTCPDSTIDDGNSLSSISS